MHLTDKKQQAFFSENGFLKIEDFITNEQLRDLKSLYMELKFKDTKGEMYSNMHHLTAEENRIIGEKIINICGKNISNFIEDYQIIVAAFLVKSAGELSESSLHQDWSIVDESIYNSLIIWIPLINVDEHNGCIQVLPKSHKWFNTIRSSNISSLFIKFNHKINSYVKPIPLNIQEALLFSSKLFHGSKVNLSSQERPAITITLIDKKAKYLHYLKTAENNAVILESENKYAFNNFFNFSNSNQNKEVIVLGEINNIKDYQISESTFFKKLYKDTFLPLKWRFAILKIMRIFYANKP